MKTMKYYYSILAVVACMFAACGTNDLPVYSEPEPEGPTQKEKNMVMDEMTWRLDSVLVIKNYQQPDETRYMLVRISTRPPYPTRSIPATTSSPTISFSTATWTPT